MMPSAEIGNVSELGRLVSAARGGGAMEDEVIELEFFDRAIDKLHTHSAHCPHCKKPISKVILRIKRETTTPIQTPDKKDFDLLGCLDCFKIFLPDKTVTHENRGSAEEDQQESNNASEGKCFDLRWFFGGTPKALTSQDQPSATITSDQGQKPDGHLRGDSSAATKSSSHYSDGTQSAYTQQQTRAPPQEMIDDDAIQQDVKHEPKYSVKPSSSTYQGGGLSSGLMESITSLSVVSSAAASGATTLNTVAIGMANLIGGSFVVAHNLLDLKIKSPEEEYNKVLGQRNHFLLHAIVAMLSYLIFGLAPPALYGFTFRQSDDGDLKLLSVALASFVCILLLAIGKAYTSGANTFNQYFVKQRTGIIIFAAGLVWNRGEEAGSRVHKKACPSLELWVGTRERRECGKIY
nr:membrane protein of ER body 2-like [Ipomoea batatas]GME18558.1 membrane protein of ER body 2-like [Ipomoea batatas]